MTNSSTINEFIKKIKEALTISEHDSRLGVRGFEFDNSTSEKDCVLVIGLNLAGNEETTKNEKTNKTYLYSLKKSIKSDYVYNKFYKPINELMNDRIFKYIEGFYNSRRRHSKLNYLCPNIIMGDE